MIEPLGTGASFEGKVGGGACGSWIFGEPGPDHAWRLLWGWAWEKLFGLMGLALSREECVFVHIQRALVPLVLIGAWA